MCTSVFRAPTPLALLVMAAHSPLPEPFGVTVSDTHRRAARWPRVSRVGRNVDYGGAPLSGMVDPRCRRSRSAYTWWLPASWPLRCTEARSRSEPYPIVDVMARYGCGR